MNETCTECGKPATAHALTCWLGPRTAPRDDDRRPDEYRFNLVGYLPRRERWFGVIKLPPEPAAPECDGQLTGITSRCGGRGWLAVEDGEIYCSCAAGERLRKSE